MPSVEIYAREPEIKLYQAMVAEVSAYTSEVAQTDSSPFITASNQRVRDGIVANNCLDFETKVEIYGKLYEVQDRMNRRYSCEHFDIWFEDKEEALIFGRQEAVIILR